MRFAIKVPFSEIVFENASKKHKKFFEELFFDKVAIEKPIYKIIVRFKLVILSRKDNLYLEENICASQGNMYISDTQGSKLIFNTSSLKDKLLVLTVEPGFDLYYLYNFVIEPLIIIWAAKNGLLYIHSSALYKNGKAYVFAAWRHTGKTSSIFSLANDDTGFMGDDFSVISYPEVYLYPKAINIFSYNFRNYPWLYKKISSLLGWRIKISIMIKDQLMFISGKIGGSLAKVFFRLSELAEVSTNTKVSPKRIGMKAIKNAKIGKVVLITKADRPTEVDKRIDMVKVKQKLLSTILYEINDFMNIYQKYKYIYPGRKNPTIDFFEENYLLAVERNIRTAYEANLGVSKNSDAGLVNL